MYAGNGYYLAQGLSSSSGYGPCCSYVTVPDGTLVYNASLAATLIGIRNDQQKAYLGRIVPFLHYYGGIGGDWTVTHSYQLLQNISSGPRASPQDSQHADLNIRAMTAEDWWSFFYGTLGNQQWVSSLSGSRANIFRDSLGYLQSLFTLIGYQDPISLMRSIIVNPSNPWGEFEPENFEAYKKALWTTCNKIVKGWPATTMGISDPTASRLGVGAVDAWANSMANTIIPGIYQTMSSGAVQSIRDNEVRAGGDQQGKTFLATGAQVEAMQNNPFLYVEASPVPGAIDMYYTNYYYPDATDATRFMKLVNRTKFIPPAVVSQLKSGCCKGNNTQLLLRTLLTEVMRPLYGYPYFVPAAVALVSIHPYNDFNGRSTRFFSYIASLEARWDPVVSFLPDFDLVRLRFRMPTFV